MCVCPHLCSCVSQSIAAYATNNLVPKVLTSSNKLEIMSEVPADQRNDMLPGPQK